MVGNFAYVAAEISGISGLQIIDISNPASPSLKGSYDGYDTPDSVCYRVYVVENYAYVTGGNVSIQTPLKKKL